jgi:hypothetical protein
VPCLPTWPIVKLKLQGAVDGYATDDLIVFVENSANKNEPSVSVVLIGPVIKAITSFPLVKTAELLKSLQAA